MHGVRMNSFFRFPQAVLAAAVLASMTATAQPIKLGELNSYKTFPAFLEPYKKGMELAVEEINAGGGVLGRSLELVTRDDNGNAGDAVRVGRALGEGESRCADGDILFRRRACRGRFRSAAAGLLSRCRAADRQDR